MKARAVMLALTVWALAGTASGADLPLDLELVRAAGSGELETVEALLKSGADVNYEIKPGLSALTEAIRNNHIDVVRALLSAGPDLNRGRKQGRSPIMVAASSPGLDSIPLLLEAGANPHVVSASGSTPLWHAVEHGRIDLVKKLLEAGADPSPRATLGGGRSALVWTSMSQNFEMATLLVQAGAKVNDVTDYQESALRLMAGGATPQHLELVRLLLAKGADTEAGQIPVRRLATSCFDWSGICGNYERGMRKAEGTALGIAAESGSIEIVKALLEAGARVDAPQPGWRTPLMIAAVAGRPDVVRVLLDAGAKPDAVDGNKQTALMRANSAIQVKAGLREVIAMLQAAEPASAATSQ